MTEPHSSPKPFDHLFVSQLNELFRWRRDVRRFQTRPIDESLLTELIYSCLNAPSVGNSQPWRFVVVKDQRARHAVCKNFEKSNDLAALANADDSKEHYNKLKLAGLKEAPVHLAVYCDKNPVEGKGLGRQSMPETLEYSVVLAIGQLWYSALAHGIGLGWVSILDPDEINATLDTPDNWRLIAYLCMGYPEEQHSDPELVRENWQGPTDYDTKLFYR